VWSQQFREIIQQLRRTDRAMLVASHNLDELERICDRVVIIDRGRIQRIVDLRAVAETAEKFSYRVRVSAGADALLTVFPGAKETSPGDVLLPALDLVTLNRGLARAIAEGAIISAVQPERSALEREFHAAVRAPGGNA
jgi:ABC-type multidrug transport system ATPase subunit